MDEKEKQKIIDDLNKLPPHEHIRVGQQIIDLLRDRVCEDILGLDFIESLDFPGDIGPKPPPNKRQ